MTEPPEVPDALICRVAECPECGAAVLCHLDADPLTGCADHPSGAPTA